MDKANADLLHVLFVTPEIAPYSKAGHLAEISRRLPAELKMRGVDVTILTPHYGTFTQEQYPLAERLTVLDVPAGHGKRFEVKIFEGKTVENVRVFFLANEIFRREPIYGNHRDNDLRFGLFSRAVCEFVDRMPVPVDIIHCNDWSTSLVPVFLEECYPRSKKLADVLVLTSIHDLSFQGHFEPNALARLGLPNDLNHPENLEFYGKINFLKGGILYADMIALPSNWDVATAVKPEHAFGLDGVLRIRKEDLIGVVNGIDNRAWDPALDQRIHQTYDAEHLNGKRQCKAALQRELNLAIRPTKALLGFVGPFTEPRGLDMISDILDDLMDRGAQLVFVGTGDAVYEEAIRGWAAEFPDSIAFRFGQDEALLHRFFSGIDAFLAPTRYEPGAYQHLIAMRYGAPPICRAVTAMADTIAPWAPGQSAKANGFTFDDYDPDHFFNAVMDALDLFDLQQEWRMLQQNGMAYEKSWRQTAEAFIAAYRELLG